MAVAAAWLPACSSISCACACALEICSRDASLFLPQEVTARAARHAVMIRIFFIVSKNFRKDSDFCQTTLQSRQIFVYLHQLTRSLLIDL